jgi:hypothetical protein
VTIRLGNGVHGAGRMQLGVCRKMFCDGGEGEEGEGEEGGTPMYSELSGLHPKEPL